MELFLFTAFMLAMTYVLVIAPQKRRMRSHQAVVTAIDTGDDIVTFGGLHGRVTGVDDSGNVLRVELGPGIEVRLDRMAVSRRLSNDLPTDEHLPEDD